MRRVIAMFLTAGIAASPVDAAKVVAPLPPSSSWQMDYAPSECRLLRSFGKGKERITLQIGRLDVADLLEMSLAGARIPPTDIDVVTAVSTSTMAQVPGIRARGFAATKDAPGSIRFRADADLPRALRGDVAVGRPTLLGIKFVRGYAVQLDLGSMKAPLAALDKCMDNLFTGWGLNPGEQRQRITAPEPVGNPASWLRSDDYPPSQNYAGLGGIVVLRLLIAADGAVQNCAASKAGGDKIFEEVTCRAVTARGKFRPATGPNGQPIRSVWINRIVWQPGAPFATAP